MTVRERSYYVDKCRQSINLWEKLFENNSICDSNLIFVQTHLDNHFTVLVFNVHNKLIEDINNRSDNKHFIRYAAMLCFARFLSSNQNNNDCGIYSVKAMDWYDGGNEKM
ncbi:putative ubiquitin-like-specific protease 1B [Bienertia sinuspersici]